MKPSLVSGIIVLALSGYFGYHIGYVRPRETLQQVQKGLKEAQQEQELRSEVAVSLEKLEREQKQFAPKADPDWLLQEVGKLTRDAGVQVTSLSPQPIQKQSEFTQLAVSLQFEATYHQLGQFLSHVEHAEHAIRIDELDVSPQRANAGRAQVRLVLSTLYVPPVAGVEAAK